MKKAKNTKKLVRDIYTNNLRVTTTNDLDKRVLANSTSVLEKLNSQNLANTRPNIWLTITKSPLTRLAAVLVVLSAIYFFASSDNNEFDRHTADAPQIADIPEETPAELVSVIRLNMAFRDGGMKAMEEQLEKAEKKVKPDSKTPLTVDQLICELNGG